jgi:hypothetical protein
MNFIERSLKQFRDLPEKKRYIEFITALLTIPVLLSVIILNYSNLNGSKKDTNPPSEEKPTVITIVQERDESGTPTPTPSVIAECKPEVGNISITSPEENETATQNPLTISIKKNDKPNEYCAVVWSYRINGGSWSNFDDKDISIFDMKSGEKNLEIRIKSLISGEEKTLKRTFLYENTQEVEEPSPTSTAAPAPTSIVTP